MNQRQHLGLSEKGAPCSTKINGQWWVGDWRLSLFCRGSTVNNHGVNINAVRKESLGINHVQTSISQYKFLKMEIG